MRLYLPCACVRACVAAPQVPPSWVLAAAAACTSCLATAPSSTLPSSALPCPPLPSSPYPLKQVPAGRAGPKRLRRLHVVHRRHPRPGARALGWGWGGCLLVGSGDGVSAHKLRARQWSAGCSETPRHACHPSAADPRPGSCCAHCAPAVLPRCALTAGLGGARGVWQDSVHELRRLQAQVRH